MLIYTILSQIALHLSFLSFSVLYFFFSLNKIALHLSVNILIKFSFLVKDLKFCFFLFYFIWVMKFYFIVRVHTFLTLKFQSWAHIFARIGLNRSAFRRNSSCTTCSSSTQRLSTHELNFYDVTSIASFILIDC